MVGRSILVFLVALSVAACTQQRGSRMGSAIHWHTKVYRGIGEEGKEAGQKSLLHSSMTALSQDRARVSVSLPGLLPRGEYAWGVYSGSCDGTLVGSESDYPTIVPNEHSRGSFTATVDGNFDASQGYYLKIFENGGQRDSMLGCSRMRVGTEEEAEEAA